MKFFSKKQNNFHYISLLITFRGVGTAAAAAAMAAAHFRPRKELQPFNAHVQYKHGHGHFPAVSDSNSIESICRAVAMVLAIMEMNLDLLEQGNQPEKFNFPKRGLENQSSYEEEQSNNKKNILGKTTTTLVM